MTGNLALLRSLVRGDVEALRHALSDPATDVAGFLGFARRHQLGAYVYRTLRQLGLISILPPQMVAGAKAASLVERALSERLTQQMHELGELFDRGGARVMFIKGPLFAQRFYGSLDARGLFDLDVLIQAPGEIQAIEALLIEAGFKRAHHVPVSRRLGQYFAHHFEYRRESLPLDVHWALQRHFTFAIDYPRIWATSTRVGLKGHTYEATSNEYELVLQIVGVVTDLQVGRLKLRSLVDVYRILRTVEGTLDWGDFFSWRDRERILRASVYVLSVVLDVLDCRDEFPRLGTHLESTMPSLPPTDLAFRAVMQSRPFDLSQKLLALRLYDAPLAVSLSWWLVSLPFRLAVYGVTPRPHRRRA